MPSQCAGITANTSRLLPMPAPLPCRYYWHRMAGTALSWFVWDFAFYGNKLFQSAFINAVIGGTPTLIQVSVGPDRPDPGPSAVLLPSTAALVHSPRRAPALNP